MSAMRDRPRRWRLRRSQVLRALPVLALVLALTWMTFVVSAASIIRNALPERALAFAWFDAGAKAKLAEQILAASPTDRNALRTAQTLSVEALRRDPSLVMAWRNFALADVALGRSGRAQRLFHLAERMSRRDLPTQLWLIEEQVNRNNIPGALHHYDVALRTSITSHDLLLPILVHALNSDGVAGPLGALLAQAPPWRDPFLGALIQDPPKGENVATLLERVTAAAPLTDTSQLRDLPTWYADRHEFNSAWRIYNALRNRRGAHPEPVRNGEFEQANPQPPFDWQLASASEYGAEQRRAVAPGRGQSLFLYATPGNSGVAARQLLLLGPGNYSLSALIGRTDAPPPERLVWKITCATAQPTIRLSQDTAPVANGRTLQFAFNIPASGCEAQWLTVEISQGSGGTDGAEAWVDLVRIHGA